MGPLTLLLQFRINKITGLHNRLVTRTTWIVDVKTATLSAVIKERALPAQLSASLNRALNPVSNKIKQKIIK